MYLISTHTAYLTWILLARARLAFLVRASPSTTPGQGNWSIVIAGLVPTGIIHYNMRQKRNYLFEGHSLCTPGRISRTKHAVTVYSERCSVFPFFIRCSLPTA